MNALVAKPPSLKDPTDLKTVFVRGIKLQVNLNQVPKGRCAILVVSYDFYPPALPPAPSQGPCDFGDFGFEENPETSCP